MDHLDRNLGFLLHDVARLMRKRFEQNARELGLTRSQCSVLAHLARHDGIQQGALAEILEVEPITLTRLVDRLEEMGLVAARHPEHGNGRISEVTPKGAALITEVLPLWRQAQADMKAELSSRTFDDSIKMLKRLAKV